MDLYSAEPARSGMLQDYIGMEQCILQDNWKMPPQNGRHAPCGICQGITRVRYRALPSMIGNEQAL